MGRIHFSRQKPPTHPLLCEFKEIALSLGFTKIEITTNTIEEFLSDIEQEKHEVCMPHMSRMIYISKLMKHIDVIKLFPCEPKKAPALDIPFHSALVFLSQYVSLLDRTTISKPIEITVYTKHQALGTSNPNRILLQLIISSVSVRLQLCRLYNGFMAQPGSYVYY